MTDAAPAAGGAHHSASEAEDEEMVRPSNGPTDNAAMNDIDPDASVSDQVEAAASARGRHVDEPGREGEERDRGSPELGAFLEELHHGLPRSYTNRLRH